MVVLYTFLRPFSLVALNVYYRISVTGKENVPAGAPIIFAPSHSNGFVDPVILAMQVNRRVRFFARGDVFKGKLAKFLLNQMNTSPMYRMQEGYAEIKKNDKSFEECKTRLSQNKIILIFPEGIANSDRRIYPLKKGLSRIALQTMETLKYEKEIFVIPVGLNYEAQTRFRSKAFVEIGKPISVKDYEARYKEDKVRAINEFTKNLESKLGQYVHHIANPENDTLVGDIEAVYTYELLKDKKMNPDLLHNQGLATYEIINMVNALEQYQPQLLENLKILLRNYRNLLEKCRLRDHLLREESVNRMNFGTFLIDYLIIYLGIPIYLLGLLFNYFPYFLAKKLADKKVKKAEFYTSFRANLALIFWTFYFFIQLLIVALAFKNWTLLGVFASSIIFSGWYVLKFYPVMKKIFGRWRLLRMVRKDKKTVEQLMNDRNVVMSMLANAKETYLNLLNK